ncbi:MAG: glycosyltransferase family 4 protein [Rhodomicrobium sp.]|nr:glycosyltransferase family 4 protein [Rhodomicrobium sp.]
MLLVAVLAKLLSRSRAPIVYEVLDIRGVFIGKGLAGRVFRFAERALMKASSLLVVSAPEYISRYFVPYQRFDGAWFLLENKLPGPMAGTAALIPRLSLPPGPPWVIGMFGVLRCARSFDILCKLAERLGDKVKIYLRGVPSETDIPLARIEAACAAHPNVIFDGPYNNPQDLSDIYGRIHFIWTADYLDAGGNSDWSLTNRIYEGGLMGAVLISAKGLATGRMIEEKGLGFIIGEPIEESAAELIEGMTAERFLAAQVRLRAAEPSLFIDETDTLRLMTLLRRLAQGNLTQRGDLTNVS